MKKCIGCDVIITSNDKKPSVFRKQSFCSRKCVLIYRNKFHNPMKNVSVLEKVSGENSKLWLGENAGYFSKHEWIREQGIDRSKCSHCGINGLHYKNGRWSIEFCNISGEYKRNVEDWITLCRKCHRKMDLNKNKIVKVKCNDCLCDIETKFPNYVKYCEQCKLSRQKIRCKLRMRKLRGYSGRKWMRK